jgi:hypothetical protein
MPETVRGNLNNARQVLQLAVEEGPERWGVGQPGMQLPVWLEVREALEAADARIGAAVVTLDSLMGDAQLAVRSPLVERMQREV